MVGLIYLYMSNAVNGEDNMNFDLTLNQTQKLIMTQQLQMAIKILQLPSIELNEYIQDQLVENPVLEVKSDDRSSDENKIDWTEVVKNYEYEDYDDRYQEEDENTSPLNFIANETTLRDYLLFQLHLSVRESQDVQIGEYLIDNIDSAGYLRISDEDTAKLFNVSSERVSGIVKMIQKFDPSGIGSRNLEECLITQLSEKGSLTELLDIVVRKYLNEIGENRYSLIARELSITPKEAQEMGDIIKSLEPKPGRGFADNSTTRYIIPDIIIENMNGRYIVTVNEKSTPRLTINSYYRDILKNGNRDEQTREYVKRKLDSAAWLIKSIEQRRATIYNVVNSIVSFQKDFLDRGIEYLKPLTLRDVADSVGVHESTVSRAINGKYVQTPRGLYALKFFFTRGLGASYGDNISSQRIKKSIRDIIGGEDQRKPLSDQRITDMLNNDGINISRRTVAKYREEMGIPPTSKRKRIE